MQEKNIKKRKKHKKTVSSCETASFPICQNQTKQ
jgi:hypothetical protein